MTFATKKKNVIFDIDAAKARIAELVTDDMREIILHAFERAVSEVGDSWELLQSQFDVDVEVVLGEQLAKIKESIDAVNVEIKAQITDIVKANAEASSSEIRSKIESGLGDKFDKLGNARANNIARTSATSATTGSQRAAWDGLDYEMTWLAQPGARPTHAAATGIRPDDEGLFHVGEAIGIGPGNMSLAEESCNCRCTLRPRPKSEKAVKALLLYYYEYRQAA